MKQKSIVDHQLRAVMSKYPYIGVHAGDRDLVVYFNQPKTGTCLSHGHTHNIPGLPSETWDESKFTPLNGSITLEQEA